MWWLLISLATALHLIGAPGSYAQSEIKRAIDDAIIAGEFEKAGGLLATAAKGGDPDAQYKLGSLYRTGRGVPRDDALAMKWIAAAAERGHAGAQYALGQMYVAGRGHRPDQATGEKWLRRAAAQGHPEAPGLLARLKAAKASAGVTEKPREQRPQANGSGDQAISRPEELLSAAWRGRTAIVRALIAKGIDPGIRDRDGNTPLILGARAGSRDVVAVLLSAAPTTIEARNAQGETALLAAASKGHVEIVAHLLDSGANVDHRSNSDQGVMDLAIRGCHEAVVRRLIGKTGKPSLPMMTASFSCSNDIYQTLLSASFDVMAEDENGRTALWHAATAGNAGAVDALLGAGASARAADRQGVTALHKALERRNRAIVLSLIGQGAEIERATPAGNTALMLASAAGDADLVTLLLDRGAQINTRNAAGNTALILAAKEGHRDVIQLLITKGADRKQRNRRRQTAQDIAAQSGFDEIVGLLK